MNYILLLISVTAITLKASVVNNFGKSHMNGMRDMYLFNAMFAIAAILFTLAAGGGIGNVSVYTLILGIIYGLITVSAEICALKAMQHGPMSFAVFLSSCGMLLPILFGLVILKEDASVIKYISFAVLFVAVFLVINPKGGNKKVYKWLVYGLAAMVFSGLVGILQKIHQGSAHKTEIYFFLIVAFVTYFVSCLIMAFCYRTDGQVRTFSKNLIGISFLCGVCCGANNIINLYLSGVMPAIVFFPIANGGYIILATLSARFIFNEKLTASQTAGIILGVLALCGLGI